ncbi:hypothetical protein ABFS83_11G096500 [Erythranthe nasuta]
MGWLNFHHLLLLTAALLLLRLPSAAPDISSDRSALLSFRSGVRERIPFWNLSSPTPCSWYGVTCSPDGSAVIALRLPGKSISGRIPPNTISRLTNLQALSLRMNSLSGPLPADLFSSLSSLHTLSLQNNIFSGGIPDSLFSLTGLVNLELASNNLSGPISPSFNNLTRLRTLYLQNNHFSGPIPDLNLPVLSLFNISNNNLTGQIPKGLAGKPKNSFVGNSLCGAPLDSCSIDETPSVPGNPPADRKKPEKKLSGWAIAGIVICSVLGVFLIVMLICCLCGKGKGAKKKTGLPTTRREKAVATAGGVAAAVRERQRDGGGEDGGKKKRLVFFGKTKWEFTLEDLLKASAEVLGRGTFGTAYKAALDAGLSVVVKRLRHVNMAEMEFRAKMDEIGRMDHQNLVPLKAYYYNRDEKLLVYDYLPMGSLSALLHGNKGETRTPLNWETRASIALGAAQGISYLHSHGPSISHGNIKSSNILLTKKYEPRVSDFLLARMARPGSASGPSRVEGYRAPEVTDPQRVSQKADVYSFGVLVLEMLTGKSPVVGEDGFDLPLWVRSLVKDALTSEVFDAELLRYQNVEEDMVRLLQIGVDCTESHPDKRPSMAEVATKIEELCRWSFDYTGEE